MPPLCFHVFSAHIRDILVRADFLAIRALRAVGDIAVHPSLGGAENDNNEPSAYKIELVGPSGGFFCTYQSQFVGQKLPVTPLQIETDIFMDPPLTFHIEPHSPSAALFSPRTVLDI